MEVGNPEGEKVYPISTLGINVWLVCLMTLYYFENELGIPIVYKIVHNFEYYLYVNM